ncbi:MAG: DnaJ domain-containing protein [Magnetococcales bacterium]|nr:DnaJ domain-containing protein [Magnetococcales bacterium]
MSAEFTDFYKPLGVDRNASQDEIKRAFRKLARDFHPDVNKSPGSEARFKEISAAYEVLGDEKKRSEYDQFYDCWKNGAPFPGQPGYENTSGFKFQRGGSSIDLEELFNGFFGERSGGKGYGAWFAGFPGNGGAGASACSRGFDQPSAHEVNLTLEEAFSGCKRRFDVISPGGGNKRIEVSIPAGVTDGQTIHLGARRGDGAAPMEDLHLRIRIQPHRQFRVEGKDIHLELPITPWEAALGATVLVPTLGGTVRVKIPEGCQSGKKLALAGRGLPGSPAGAQYVILNVVVPTPTTESQKDFYRKMEKEMPFDPRAGLMH